MICLGTTPGQDCRRQAHVVAQRLGPVIAPSYGVGSRQDGRPSIQCGLHAVDQNQICERDITFLCRQCPAVFCHAAQRERLLEMFCSSC